MSALAEAREQLNKGSKPVLTEEFAERVHALAGKMPDSTPVAPLGAAWNVMLNYRARKNSDPPPAAEWTEFMESLQPLEQIHLCYLLDRAIFRVDARIVGDLRAFVQLEGRYFGIGLRGKSFLAVGFQKAET